MPLEPLQKEIVAILKFRRSPKSFVGGSSVFNEHFPRISDDIDIYAEDVEVTTIAKLDVEALQKAGLNLNVNDQFYGFAVEAIVKRSPGDQIATKLEWMEPDRQRFYPIQHNKTFGWTLHKTDLAVQKLIAAATRQKPRDALDILLIDTHYAPLAALALAAPGKLENASPTNILERALRHAIGHPIEDYQALRLVKDALPFPLSEIKNILTDKVNAAIETITTQCLDATPGVLYISPKTGRMRIPLDSIIGNLIQHSITAKGTVPTFSTQRSSKSHTNVEL